MFLKKITVFAAALLISIPCFAAMQDKYELPDNYLKLEQEYLKEFPNLQPVMDAMIVETEKQYAKPQNDILHNRVCTALVYQMGKENGFSPDKLNLAIAGDILHNIAKGDHKEVLTDKEKLKRVDETVKSLKEKGYFQNSPGFWEDITIFENPDLGNNLDQIHHLTGAVMAGDILAQLGFTPEQIAELQAGIMEHSTGYWYFRDGVDDELGKKGEWVKVFPIPENELSKYIHDADLVSQFVYESVVPEGSKWRNLATKRWGAKDTPQDQAHTVYYVFQRLYDEAKTPVGKEMAKAQWDKISTDLKGLMNVKPEDDPLVVIGIPEKFQEK